MLYPTAIRDIDFSDAWGLILRIKNGRVQHGMSIAKAEVKLRYSKSSELELFTNSQGLGEAQLSRSNRKMLTFEMEYEAKGYYWNEAAQEWG